MVAVAPRENTPLWPEKAAVRPPSRGTVADADTGAAPPVLSVNRLKAQLTVGRRTAEVLSGVDFDLRRGEVLGLVGESGSGKSLTASTIMGLQPKAVTVTGGEVLFRGKNLLTMEPRALAKLRGSELAMVLQDPMTALDPVFTIGQQLQSPLRTHNRGVSRAAVRERSIALLEQVRIPGAEGRLRSYPHEFSGGMRQRAVSAIAISNHPTVLIADEPTTALDVTSQVAYLALLRRLRAEEDMSVLFITHDFGAVSRVCDRVAVMYAGEIVEIGTAAELLNAPAHPYTEALVASLPGRSDATTLRPIPGSPPDPFKATTGCPFAPRCSYAAQVCREKKPEPTQVSDSRSVSCWRYA